MIELKEFQLPIRARMRMSRFLCGYRFLLPFFIAVLGAVPARAQKWTPPTAEELAMTAQPGAPDADAVFLYYAEITDDDEETTSVYSRIKILKPSGDALARVVLRSWLPTSGYGTKIRSMEGRTIHPDGTVIPMKEKAEESIFNGPDGKTILKTYHLPQAEVGSILEYRYTLERHDHVLPPYWDVQKKYYVGRAHYEWLVTSRALHSVGKAPKAVSLIGITKRLPPGLEISRTATVDNTDRIKYELDATDIPALPEEELRPPLSSYAYRVQFYYLSANSMEEFWTEIGKRWSDAHNRFEEPGDAIKRAVAKIVEPTDTPEERLRKIYAAVMKLDNLDADQALGRPPAAMEIPVRAQTASDVLAAGRGSNDQINSVFAAMVRAAGMTAYIMRVSNRDEHIFEPGFLSMGQLDDDISIVELGGKEIFLDPGTGSARSAI
jgi:hypothetical protein